MGDSSTQTSLLKSIGALGGQYVTGASDITGSFMAVMAIEDTTISSGTVGNISGIDGLIITEGTVLLGEWTVLKTSGGCIIYNG